MLAVRWSIAILSFSDIDFGLYAVYMISMMNYFVFQIKADIETKAEFINHLIKKVNTGTYADVAQVLTFVDWLDQQLSTLVNNRASNTKFHPPFIFFSLENIHPLAHIISYLLPTSIFPV
jgi:L-ribulose-5-phosphate 3-epimerase UlaE